MSETKHTPTPWAYIPSEGDEESYGGAEAAPFLITSTCEIGWSLAAVIGDVPDLPAEANAAFIIRAVNAHDDLVEALEKARSELEAYELAATGETYNSVALNAALDKALSRTDLVGGEEIERMDEKGDGL